jgi:fructose-specific phosphotransferase system IIC component
MLDPRFKALQSVLGGVLAGFVVIMLCESFTHTLFSTPEGLNFQDKEAVTNMMKSASIEMYLSVLIGYIFASFLAGYVTNYLSRNSKYRPAMIAGFALMVFGILNMTSLWHPTWFWVVSIPCYLLFAFLGGNYAPKGVPAQ